MANKILAADMWAIHNFGNPNERYRAFLLNGKPRFQNFFDSTILYDEIVVPTDDFMSFAVLVGVLGAGPVSTMLDAGLLRLVRSKGALAYVGNGGGLHSYKIKASDGNLMPFSAHTEEALLWALQGLNSIDAKQARTLTDKTLKYVQEVALSTEERNFREQTYADVSKSSYLQKHFGLEGDISKLPGINPKGVRIYGGPDAASGKGDQIDSLLKIAHANLEMRLADLAGCSDVATGNPIGHLLRGKQDRAKAQMVEQGKIVLRELADVPDIGTWVLDRPDRLDALLKLRSSSSAVAFRQWFHSNVGEDGNSVAKAYVQLLKDVHPLQNSGVRVLRFLVTSGWALIEPISGGIAAVADNFLLDRFLNKSDPKFFLENLRQLPTK